MYIAQVITTIPYLPCNNNNINWKELYDFYYTAITLTTGYKIMASILYLQCTCFFTHFDPCTLPPYTCTHTLSIQSFMEGLDSKKCALSTTTTTYKTDRQLALCIVTIAMEDSHFKTIFAHTQDATYQKVLCVDGRHHYVISYYIS